MAELNVKIKIDKSLDYFPDNKDQHLVYNKNITVDDSIFDNLVVKHKPLTKKTLWYATFDDNIIRNYNGKTTYTSEKMLWNGLKSTFDSYITLSLLGIEKNSDYTTSITIDKEDIMNQLKESGRLKIHRMDYTDI